jgi:hypothetical protein
MKNLSILQIQNYSIKWPSQKEIVFKVLRTKPWTSLANMKKWKKPWNQKGKLFYLTKNSISTFLKIGEIHRIKLIRKVAPVIIIILQNHYLLRKRMSPLCQKKILKSNRRREKSSKISSLTSIEILWQL